MRIHLERDRSLVTSTTLAVRIGTWEFHCWVADRRLRWHVGRFPGEAW